MARKKNNDIAIAEMAKDIEYIKKAIEAIDDKLNENFVTKVEFDPVRRLVYGVVSLILISVILAILALVILQPS